MEVPTGRRRHLPERRGTRTRSPKGWSADVLQVFAGLEPNRASRRDAHFLARAGIAADAPLAWLHLEDPESSQLDPLAALHRGPHRVEHRVDGHLGFHLGDVGDLRHFVDDVDLDHA